MWILGPSLFRVIGLFELQMQTSIVILRNESKTFIFQISNVAIVKLEPNDDSVFVLFGCEDDNCTCIDFSNTSHFPFKSIMGGGVFTLQKILFGDGILYVKSLKTLYVMVFYM
jgi:hypothetical protein